ncbi:UNC93-like protein [Dreissena polymorpha]|uniref:Protein unc-93 homolog A n=1 Tax=Dreissena polymorpha TaxID=45954 RepID=A0A9D4MXP6_DREPO|nr:UNC93-like protein [Dreissena polymorpha]KAH3885245.1 hypothetical protein DPMN_009238 [Dreissena polymorpha]
MDVNTTEFSLAEISDPKNVLNDDGYKTALSRKFQLRLNLAWLCLIWVFTFTAYSGLQNLEASLVPGFGVYSLAAITGGGLVSCILAPAIIAKINAKGALIFSWICLSIFVACNYYPLEYVLLPGAAIEGLSTGLMWTAQGAFLTTIAVEYSDIIKEPLEAVLSRFFGIFCMAFQSTQIWGNVISSAVLHEAPLPDAGNASSIPSFCGADDCPWDKLFGGSGNSTMPLPAQWRIYTLISIYLGFTIIGLIITVFLLKPIKSEGAEVSVRVQLQATLRLLFTDRKMALLVPMSIWTGMEQSILFVEFTRSYVACVKGLGYVGLTMICFGVVNTIGSPLSGLLGKYMGRIPLCWLATLLNLAVLALMRFWTPTPSETYVFFLIPGVWGLADAIWQTQSGAMIGAIFSTNQEPAYANLRLFQAAGFTMAYLYSNSLCEYIKLYIAAAVVVVGIILQTVVEIIVRRSETRVVEMDIKY